MRKGSYFYTFALALDRFAAALLFNRPDITISSLCGLVLAADAYLFSPQGFAALKAVTSLKLSRWQKRFLTNVGKGLELLSKGHCQRAIASDVETADSTKALLQ